MSRITLSVVIPVYRSEATLAPLTQRLLAVLNLLVPDHEVIFVDDGSPDDSWQVLRELQAAHPDRIVAVQLMRNFGQQNAQMCGFRHARGDYIVTMDDDLQHPPEEIPKLLQKIELGGFDLVYGVYGDKQHSGWRNAGSALINAFYRMTFRNRVMVTSFRIIRSELVRSILSYDLNFTFIDGLLAWNTQRIGEVAVEHRPRTVGRSGYNPFKLMTLAFNLLTNFSLLPLQIVSLVGFVTAAGGILAAIFYLFEYVTGGIKVLGYASIMIAMLVLGGVQLLALGIMGEYLGRLHLNVNRKPQHVVRQVLGLQSEKSGEITSNDSI